MSSCANLAAQLEQSLLKLFDLLEVLLNGRFGLLEGYIDVRSIGQGRNEIGMHTLLSFCSSRFLTLEFLQNFSAWPRTTHSRRVATEILDLFLHALDSGPIVSDQPFKLLDTILRSLFNLDTVL